MMIRRVLYYNGKNMRMGDLKKGKETVIPQVR
jgi:hypothetical protein